jgi:hypothetical protein
MMKNLFHPTLSAALILAGLLCSTPTTAQNCTITCKDDLVVAVPANGTYTLLPQTLAETDLSVVCPNGDFQTQVQINTSWTPASGHVVFDESHIGQTLTCRVRDLNSGNNCWGQVQVVELDTIRFSLCASFWKNNQPIKGVTLQFQPYNPSFPYAPMVFDLDTSQHCVEMAIVPADYLPGTTFTYTTSLPDTGHLNGINLLDICRTSKHILGINPLESPYAMLAADVNLSGAVTTFDLVETQKLIKGIYTELPNNTVWRFFPDYIQFPNPSNPFMGCPTCPTSLDISALALLDGGTARVIGTKVGDSNGDARMPGEPFIGITPLDSVTLLLPQGQVNAGASVVVAVKMNENLLFGSLGLVFNYDETALRYDSISSEALTVYTSMMSVLQGGRLHFLFTNVSQESFVPAGIPLFYIHFTTLQTTQMEDALSLVTNGDFVSYAIGNDCETYVETGSDYSGFVSAQTPPGLPGIRVAAPSPNPYSDQTFMEIEADQPMSALLEVLDLTGRVVYASAVRLNAGLNRREIPAGVLTPGSMGIWRVRVDQQVVSGKLYCD